MQILVWYFSWGYLSECSTDPYKCVIKRVGSWTIYNIQICKITCKILQTFYKHGFINHPYLLIDSLTHCMEQCPWEANQFSTSQDIPHILWNLTVDYCIHKWPPPVPILKRISPVHDPTSRCLKNYLNINLSSVPGYSKWPLSLRFPDQNRVYISPLSHDFSYLIHTHRACKL
jgi:hypothetical protein